MVSLGAAGPLSGFGGCLSRGCVLDFDERKGRYFGMEGEINPQPGFKVLRKLCLLRMQRCETPGVDEMEKPAVPLLK